MQDTIVANPTLGKSPTDNDRENVPVGSVTGLPLRYT